MNPGTRYQQPLSLALLAVLALAAPSWSQDCPKVRATVNPGDGSAPVAPWPTIYWGSGGKYAGTYLTGGWGSSEVSIISPEEASFPLMGGGPDYFIAPVGGYMICKQVPGCTGYPCEGSVSASLNAIRGAAAVFVMEVPGEAPVANRTVVAGQFADSASAHHYAVATDASGRASFGADTPNHWLMALWPTSTHRTDGNSSEYLFHTGKPCQGVAATVYSSQVTPVTLIVRRPGTEDPDDRSCPWAGKPVTVLTGNMHFDHTDGEIAGLGGGLRFTRSYNSSKIEAGKHGVFGAGWYHAFERRLEFPWANVILLRGSDGIPLYFSDPSGSGAYGAALPVTEKSRIVRQGDGSFRHYQREGSFDAYDAGGRLTQIVDTLGNATVLTYDEAGRLESITAPGGRSFALAYSGSQIASLSGPGGVLATYTYDATSRLEAVTHPDGSGHSFEYDANGRILAVRDATGRVVEQHDYDAQGRAISSELADGRERYTLTYDDQNGQTVVTDALGSVTTHDWRFFHGSRRITRTTGPCPSCGGGGGVVREWAYDQLGRVVTQTDAAGVVTRTTYNTLGDVESETVGYGTPLARATNYTYTYDGSRILTMTRTDPGGGATTTTYGLAGPTEIIQRVSETESRTTTMTYTTQGQLQTVKDPRNQTTDKVTTYTYDPVTGDLASLTDPLGHATTFGYDSSGRRKTVTDALSHATTTAYDPAGRVKRVTAHDGTYTEMGYDEGGRRTSVRDPNGKITRHVYDAYGWLEQVIDPAGGVTRYGYDLMGQMTSLTDANGNTTAFEYTEGKVTRVIYPGGGEEVFTYDAAGRLETKTDRKGVVTTYQYDDALGRLTGKTYSDGTTPPVTYAYDENGQLGRLTSASNGTDTLTWTYNLAGELLSEHSSKNASTVAYAYDADGSRWTVGLDGTLHVTYAYDDAGRLDTITKGTSVFAFDYDEVNRRASMTYPNGVVTTYGYDELDRLKTLAASLGATPITSFTYTLDAAGNRTRKQTLDHAEAYAYDALYQLTGVDRSGAETKRWVFDYDKVGNRLTDQVSDQATSSLLSAAYNEKNQLLSRSAGGTMRWRGFLDEPGTVTYTSATVNDRPARMLGGNVFEADIEATPGTNAVTLRATDPSGNTTTKTYTVDVGGTAATYTYDQNGNLEAKTEGADVWRYMWNAENQLIRVCKNASPCDDASAAARFAYDPLGRRVEKVAAGATTAWAYDAEDILREARGGAAYAYVHGPGIDEPLARINSGGDATYYHADGLGSIARMTDGAGAATLTRHHDAWGNLDIGASEPGYAFTGREWDPATSLHYYRTRYYDPTVGRFVSEDHLPIADRARSEASGYSMAAGNPVNRVDPYGLESGTTFTSMWCDDTPGCYQKPRDTACACKARGGTWGSVADHQYGGSTRACIKDCMGDPEVMIGCGAMGVLLSEGGPWAGFGGGAACAVGACALHCVQEYCVERP